MPLQAGAPFSSVGRIRRNAARTESPNSPWSRTLQIDRANLRILQALQKNSKLSFNELSEAVNLSPSPCFFRVRKLEQAGVIRSYHAHIDLERLGPHVMVMTEITLEKHTPQFAKFQQYLEGVPRGGDRLHGQRPF